MDRNYQQQPRQPQNSIMTPNSLTQSPQTSPYERQPNPQNTTVTINSNHQNQPQQQAQQQPPQPFPIGPIPQTPPHYTFSANEHSFLDLLMSERKHAIQNHKAYHTWDGYADEFMFEFLWRPNPRLIEEWNVEWEKNWGFWWGLHPEYELDILHPRRRHREARR